MKKSKKELYQYVQKKKKELTLPLHLMNWFDKHYIFPKEFLIKNKRVYLITDNNGFQDASYRIFINSETLNFGLEMTDINGVSHIIFENASLKDTIENM